MTPLHRSLRTLLLATTLVVSMLAATGPAVDEILLTGRVTDAGTGSPLEGAQVWVDGTSVGTLTHASGAFRLTVPDAQVGSELTLVVQLIGYERSEHVLRVGAEIDSGRAHLEVALTQQALSLEALHITGDVPAGRRVEAERAAAGDAAQARQALIGPRPGNVATAAPTTVIAQRRRANSLRVDGDREQYAHIVENGFRAVRDEPLSTFSSDVDRASYSNIRRFLLREHRLPPAGAVQIEEMVNYFSYDYAGPRGDDPVGITTELGPAPWNRSHRLLRIGLATRAIVTEDLPPSNLVFLLDVSGSMQAADKLPLVKRSLRLLVEQLRPEDRVAVVVYAGAAGLALESTSGRHKDRIIEAIERLEAGGSTAGGEGLRLAYRVARENFMPRGNNRVILATDGDFNVGESSDAAMVDLIEEKREEGTFLTVLGFGTGNLQSEKMQSIAQHGNGNYAYIDGLVEARKVFVSEMGGTLVTVAKDVKIQVEFNPAFVESYRLIGYENRLLANQDFNDDRKDAGDLGAGHTVTALYEIVPPGASSVDVPGVEPLRYQARSHDTPLAEGDEVAFVRVRYKRPDGARSRLVEHPVVVDESDPSHDFGFAAAVAGFGMLLRDSEYRGSLTTRDVLALAADCVGDDLDGYRRGFVELVHAYRELTEDQERREHPRYR